MLGLQAAPAGNIKCLLDHRRTPETQTGFADARVPAAEDDHVASPTARRSRRRWRRVANATRLRRQRCGAWPARVRAASRRRPGLFDAEALLERPDRRLHPRRGAELRRLRARPTPTALVQRYMKIYKMGDGPVYTFYRPYHLEPARDAADGRARRAVRRCGVTPVGAPVCDVDRARQARPQGRRDARRRRRLHRATASWRTVRSRARDDLLPMGLTDGCVLKRDLPKDAAITLRRRRAAGGPRERPALARAGRALSSLLG